MAAIMEMESDADDTLRKLAGGNTMDCSTWPCLLATVVARIEKTARNDFPIPRIPQQPSAPPPPSPQPRFMPLLPPSSDTAEPVPSSSNPDPEPPAANTTTSDPSSSDPSSQENNRENAAPPPSAAPLAPPAPPTIELELELEPGTLPPQITAMLAEITDVLNKSFHTYPPHTIQRLAELVLEPRKHYKSLPAYLHAVDRVVHVTSGNNIYPLPPALPDMSHMHINGTGGGGGGGSPSDSASAVVATASEDSADAEQLLPTQAVWAAGTSNGGTPIGSDEALGGALLTPIPWLARRAANGGDGSSESGESSTLGSEAGGPSPAPPVSSSGTQTRQGRQFEMQVRTESTETIDGPNGMGSIETVSVSINGVSSMSAAQQHRVISQGELIRQEQRAGVVSTHRSGPLMVTSSSSPSEGAPDTAMGDGEGTEEASKDPGSEQSDDDMADDEEAPHARGPDLIGAADMGPQTGTVTSFSISRAGNANVRGIDVEAAVGRKHEAQVSTHPAVAAAAATSDSSSDDAVVLTPASSEADPAAATATPSLETTVEGREQANGKEAASQTEGDSAAKAGATAQQPASATLSARNSPVKREAEADLSAAESEPKRLRSSTLEAEEAPAASAAAPEAAPPPEAEAEALPDGDRGTAAGPVEGGAAPAASARAAAADKKEEEEEASPAAASEKVVVVAEQEAAAAPEPAGPAD